MQALHLARRPAAIPLTQACASIGQIRLMHMYETLFAQYDTPIGQVLLTWDDLRSKRRYLNLRNTLFALLDCGAAPIINENDSVGIDEIRFGDNDSLGAQTALLVNADLFVNLTSVNGLYDKNPSRNARARHIPVVQKVSHAVHALAEEHGTAQGVGGMVTKLKAAETVTRAGIFGLIADGYNRRLIDALRDPEAGTLFIPSPKRMSSRSRWIAFTGKSLGLLIVDDGARRAIRGKGKSLLPAGIKTVEGKFNVGDMVDIAASDRRVFARGISNYGAEDVSRIRGRRSTEIGALLGPKSFTEVVHRNNMSLVD
jgi:glutamate 5-kinase